MARKIFQSVKNAVSEFMRDLVKEPVAIEKTPEEIAAEKLKQKEIAKAKNKVSKKHLIRAIGSGNAAIMIIMLAFLALIIGVRFGALTPAGRAQIVKTFDGMNVGRIGTLNIEGLEGDFFTNFKLRYASISDENGIWIEGRNFHVEWDSLALIGGLVHINNASAKGVRIYRRPILKKDGRHLKRYIIALQIDKAKSPIESFPGFSVVHGIGGAAGVLELHHNKDFKLKAKLISIKRFSDGASIDIETRDGVPIHSFVGANEASGGAIAGALGLDTNRALLINSRLLAQNGIGNINTIGLSGAQKFADIKGSWDKAGGRIDGTLDFSVSSLTRKLAIMFGQSVRLDSNWMKNNTIGTPKTYQTRVTLAGKNAFFRLNGDIDFKARRSIAPLDLNLNILSLSDFLQSNSVKGANANLGGKLDITRSGALFSGNYQILAPNISTITMSQISGPVSVINENGQTEIKTSFLGAGGVANNIASRALGANPRGNIFAVRSNDGRWFINDIEIFGHALNLKGSGSRNILGALELNGKANLNVAPIIGRGYSGLIDVDFKATQNANLIGGGTVLQTISVGKQLRTANTLLDEIIGPNPQLDARLVFFGGDTIMDNIKLKTLGIEARGKSINLAAPIATLGGEASFGQKVLEVVKLDGAATGSWGLAINKANSKTSLSLDLVGSGLSSNNSIIDNLLTKAPKIKGIIGFSNEGAQITNGQIIAPKANADFSGDISRANGFNLNLGWKIIGPSQFGKVEIAGNMLGTGAIIGPIGSPLLKLASEIEEVNLGFTKLKNTKASSEILIGQTPFQAKINLNGATDFGQIIGDGTLIAVPNGFEVRAISLNGAGIAARGSARLLEDRDPSADIAFTIGQGAILQSGNLTGRILLVQNGNQTMANLSANGSGFRLRGKDTIISNLNISGNGPLSNLNLDTRFASAGEFPISFIGNTHISGQNNIYGIDINGRGSLDGRAFTTTEPIRIGFEKDKQTARGIVNFSSSSAVDQGFVDFNFLQNRQGVQNHIKAQNLALTLIGRDLMGTFSGEMDLNGRGNDLRGFMFGELRDARTRGLNGNLALNGNINARLNDSVLSLDIDAANAQGLKIDAKTKLPVIASASPLRLAIERNREIDGSYDVKGEIRPLADLVFAGERILAGQIDSKGNIGGTLNAPKLIGNFKLERGSFRETSIGLNLLNLNLVGSTDGDKLSISNFSANDNSRGTINGQGEIILSGDGRSSFNINTRRFRIVDSDTTKIDATATLVLNRTSDSRAKLSGDLNIDFAQFSPRSLSANRVISIDVEEINRPNILNSAAQPNNQVAVSQSVRRNQENVDLDVAISAPRGVFVRGSGLNLELSLDAHAKGNLSAPILTGLAKVYRGEYEYSGRSFVFDESGTIVLSSNPNNIRLNLLAERQDNNLTAKISIGGTAADPKVRLTSTPELPQDEILSQVLFGRSRAQLTPLETVQLAANLASLAAGGGFDVISNLRDITRLDRLVFSNTASGEISVAGGKYLGRDLYLELISEGTQGISSRVEWRPTKSTAVISRLGAEGDAKISIRWRRDIK